LTSSKLLSLTEADVDSLSLLRYAASYLSSESGLKS